MIYIKRKLNITYNINNEFLSKTIKYIHFYRDLYYTCLVLITLRKSMCRNFSSTPISVFPAMSRAVGNCLKIKKNNPNFIFHRFSDKSCVMLTGWYQQNPFHSIIKLFLCHFSSYK